MTGNPLTHSAPTPPGLSSVLDRNIQRMRERRAAEESEAALSERISDRITRFAGSMTFVVIHALLYGGWIAINHRETCVLRSVTVWEVGTGRWLVVVAQQPLVDLDIGCVRWSLVLCDNPWVRHAYADWPA